MRKTSSQWLKTWVFWSISYYSHHSCSTPNTEIDFGIIVPEKEESKCPKEEMLWRREEDGVLNWLFLQGCYSIEPNIKQKL